MRFGILCALHDGQGRNKTNSGGQTEQLFLNAAQRQETGYE